MELRSTCRCCLIRSPVYDLKKPYERHQNTEIYADILKDCFEIHILSNSNDSLQGICSVCVVRLLDAFNFKYQVIQCQKQLMKQNIDIDVQAHEDTNIEEDIRSDDEQGEVEWLELVSENEDVGSVVSSHSNKSETCQEMEDKVEDVKNKLPELRSWKDSSAEIPSLSEDALKPMFTRKEDGKSNVLEIDKGYGNTTQRGARCAELMKYKENMKNILKYSNCTPFFDTSILGITCAYCRKLYKDIQLLNKHIIEKHGRGTFEPLGLDKRYYCVKLDITDLRCSICDIHVNFIADLKSHLTKEHSIHFYSIPDYFAEFKLTDSKLLHCVVCDSAFETFRMLLRHMNNVHCRNYICDVCDDGFMNVHQLQTHKKTHELGEFKCSFCDKVFQTRVRLKCHENYVHKAARVTLTRCSHCDKTFPSYHQRNSHMFTEHNVQTAAYNCNICDKLFTRKSYLTCHIKTVHLMERRHICVRCGKGFYERRKLVKHMITLNCARTFECDVCHKIYATKFSLRQHMRIH